MVSDIDALGVRKRLGRDVWSPPREWGLGWSWHTLPTYEGPRGLIVVTPDWVDGVEWIHASMSRRGRVPDYDDLKLLHAAVFKDGWAYLPFAPPSEHVNLHEFVLHLWGRIDKRPALPDFARRLPDGRRSI